MQRQRPYLYSCFSEIKYNRIHYNKTFVRLYSIYQESCSIQQINTEKRIPKKKVALLFGFNGSGYQGLQFNPNIRSIEQELYNAIYKAGLVSTSNAMDPKKIQWGRAARTDKGVSAVGNVVSLKLMIEKTSDPKSIVQRINQYLPKQIRVWGYVQTTKSFQAKNNCDSRKYEYLLPSFTLMPIDQYKNNQNNHQHHQYRVSSSQLHRFSETITKFIGTHHFHNYTIGKSFDDISCKRYIKNITISQPTIQIGGLEWILVSLHGQSFMLHQIRKMIAMAILMTRSDTPTSIIDYSYKKGKLNIPKAPSLGLLLDRPIFDWYNNIKIQNNREPIDFDLYQNDMDDFKQKWIYESIFKTELENNVYDNFLQMFDLHYPIDPELGYINKEGIIPPSSYALNKV